MGLLDVFRRGNRRERRLASRRERVTMPSHARKRMLEAAKYSRLYHSWTTAPNAINRTVFQDLRGTRARSRDRSINDPYAKNFLGLLKHNVVGPQGARLQSRVTNPGGRPDRPAQRAIETAWADWSRPMNCDVTGRASFREVCNLVVGAVATDGEALIRIIRGPDAGPYGFALQLLDAELLDLQKNETLANGHEIVMGVELDIYGKPVRYHLIASDSTDPSYRFSQNRHVAVDAADMIHVFVQEAPGQVRGIPWFASVLVRQKMLHDYTKSALKAARLGSDAGLIVQTDSGSDLAFGSEEEDGRAVVEIDEEMIAAQLKAGETVTTWDPNYPHQQFPDFVKAMLRTIAAGLPGASYHALANDLEGVNFSSIRAGELENREAWKAIQNWLFEHFCSPVFEGWLEIALLTSSIPIGKGFLRLSDYEKHRRHSWQGKRWAWVDPKKDIEALIAAYEIGAMSISQIIEVQGGDPVDTWDQIASDNEEMARKGITPRSVLSAVAAGEDEEDGGAE